MTEKEIRDLMEALERAYAILAGAVSRLEGGEPSDTVARPDPRILALEEAEGRRAQPLLP
jgi:hypothetical protein